MKIVSAILFGLIYTVIYFFLAVMSTGGGHGNFFLLAPLWGWIFIFVVLFLLIRPSSLLTRILFIVSMLAHYAITLAGVFSVRDEVVKDWNRVVGREGIFITVGFYLLGQIIIWIIFLKTTRNSQTLQ